VTTFGFVDGNGNQCNMTSVNPCACNGGMTELTFMYDLFDPFSPNSATINVYTDATQTVLIASFSGVQPGDKLTIYGAGLPGDVLPSITFFEIVGRPGLPVRITTDCSEDIVAAFYQEIYVMSYIDGDGEKCSDDFCGIGRTLMC